MLKVLPTPGRIPQEDLQQPTRLLRRLGAVQPVLWTLSSVSVVGGQGRTLSLVNSRRLVSIFRWASAAVMLAAVITVYHLWLHVNPTTVALTLLMLVLFLAAKWGLRYAVATSLVATMAYNFFFLPPIGTFIINDPQNWVGLFAFLTVAVVGSRLSERAREEAEDARRRQRELEVLYGLSRELLQTENVAGLLNAIPSSIMLATRAFAVLLYLLEGDRRYLAGDDSTIAQTTTSAFASSPSPSPAPTAPAARPRASRLRPASARAACCS